MHPGQHIRREKRPRPVIDRRIARCIEPAIRREVLSDFDLEAEFLVEGH